MWHKLWMFTFNFFYYSLLFCLPSSFSRCVVVSIARHQTNQGYNSQVLFMKLVPVFWVITLIQLTKVRVGYIHQPASQRMNETNKREAQIFLIPHILSFSLFHGCLPACLPMPAYTRPSRVIHLQKLSSTTSNTQQRKRGKVTTML